MKQFKDKYELAAFIQKAVIEKFNLDDPTVDPAYIERFNRI